MSYTYKSEFFDLVNDLTSINNSIIFNIENDKIVIRRSDQQESIAYMLEAPLEYFDIDETIGFYDFIEFYRFIKTLDNPTIVKKDNKLILSKDGSKLNYLLSNLSIMKSGPKRFNFSDYSYEFDLDKESLYELLKMKTTIKPVFASFKCIENEVIISIFKDEEDNSFEKKFNANVVTDDCNGLSFDVFSDVFEKIPARHDYIVKINKHGHLNIELKNNDIKLNIYSACVKN